MRKISILVLLVALIVLLTGCAPEPVAIETVKEKVKNEFEGQLADSRGFYSKGDLKSYEISDEIVRETTKEEDIFYFTITTTLASGSYGAGDVADYYPSDVKEVSKYKVSYVLNDKKEWEFRGISTEEQISIVPLEEIYAERFVDDLKFEYRGNTQRNYLNNGMTKCELIEQKTDLENGKDIITVDLVSEKFLYTVQGKYDYIFTFNKENKAWERTEIVKHDDAKLIYTFYRDWMYEQDKDDGKAYVGLQVSYNEEREELVVNYAGGFIDNYGNRYKTSDTITWVGKSSAENQLTFKSESSPMVLSIIDDGQKIQFDKYSFNRVRK